MDSSEIRGIDDVGLPMPKGLPEDIAEPFVEHVVDQSRGAADSSHGARWAGCRGGRQSLGTPQIHGRHHGHVDPTADRARRSQNLPRRPIFNVVPAAAFAVIRMSTQRSPKRSSSRYNSVTKPIRAATPSSRPADAFRDLDDDARIMTGKPCPLLVDHRCSVYHARPINCRSLMSPDATNCHKSMRRIEAGEVEAGESPLPIEVYVVLRFLCGGEQAAVRGICRDIGLQADIVELTQTVAAIIRDPNLIGRWAAGQKVFAARCVD